MKGRTYGSKESQEKFHSGIIIEPSLYSDSMNRLEVFQYLDWGDSSVGKVLTMQIHKDLNLGR